MSLLPVFQSAFSGLSPAKGGACAPTPPSATFSLSGRVAHRAHPGAPRQPACPAPEHTWPRTTASSSAARTHASAGAGARVVHTSAVGTSDAPAPYKWSWQDDSEPAPALELDPSVVAAASSIQDLTAALRSAAATAPPRAALTTPSRTLLASAAQLLLLGAASVSAAAPPCSVADAARLLEAYGAVSQDTVVSADGATATSCGDSPPPPRVATSVLARVGVCGGGGAAGPSALQSALARDLADLLWALSELQEYDLPWDERTPVPPAAAASPPPAHALETAVAAAAPAALQRAVLARVRDQDFLAPDLCRVVCALGSMVVAAGPSSTAAAGGGGAGGGSQQQAPASGSGGFVADREVVSALNEEIRYQLTEFAADFEAADLGRLISGMAGLRLGSAVAGDEEYRRILMKAVYGKTRSLVDKASVDYALSRLMAEFDDPEARSMHYDSRWTHEELRWLPRRERDKRRILKEGWYRTQWGGWSPGGGR